MQRACNERTTRTAIRDAEAAEAEAEATHRVLSTTSGWYDTLYALDQLTSGDEEPVEPETGRQARRRRPGNYVMATQDRRALLGDHSAPTVEESRRCGDAGERETVYQCRARRQLNTCPMSTIS